VKYNVGELVWIVDSFNEARIEPPALVISAYKDLPRVSLNDPEANAQWLTQEDLGEGCVYDILFMGSIESGVSEAWLRPCQYKIIK